MRDLILLHGALGDATQLEPLKAELEGRFRCHLVEFEGHGRTSTQHPYSIERFTDNVKRYLADRHLDRASIFGYSMGGYVALTLAANLRTVESVSTLATKLAWTPEVAASEARRLDAAKIREKVPAFAATLERRHAPSGGWEQVLSRTAAFMAGLGDAPVIDDAMLARIEQPVRLMVGDRDTIVSVDETARAAKILPKGQLAVLPLTPHPFEQTDVRRLAAQLRDFLA